MQKVSVIILNYNGQDDTYDCLKSLEHVRLSQDTKLEIIVVDNGSVDEFRVQSSEFRVNEIKVIRNEENLGFSGGNNVGIKYAIKNGADYVLILNNDTIVDKNLIQELLNAANADFSNGILAPKIYFAPGFEFHKNRYGKKEQGKVFWYAGGQMDWKNVIGHHRGVDEVDSGQFETMEETSFASGCSLMIRKDVLNKIGFFDEKHFLYYEDSDLCERVKKAGFKIIYAPHAMLWHKNAGSAGGSGSKLQDYYITRNRLIFGMRHAPIRAKLALFRESLRVLLSGRYWQKRGVLDFYLNRFGKGSYQP